MKCILMCKHINWYTIISYDMPTISNLAWLVNRVPLFNFIYKLVHISFLVYIQNSKSISLSNNIYFLSYNIFLPKFYKTHHIFRQITLFSILFILVLHFNFILQKVKTTRNIIIYSIWHPIIQLAYIGKQLSLSWIIKVQTKISCITCKWFLLFLSLLIVWYCC